MKIKRKDKHKEIANLKAELPNSTSESQSFATQNILLLVEGDTEDAYFNSLKNNICLNGSLAGVTIKIVGNFNAALKEAEKHAEQYLTIYIVTDNDKRNAFILEQNQKPFFENLLNTRLPKSITDSLQRSYNSDTNNYFLSIYDYLQWLNQAIGATQVVEYWDKIQYLTPRNQNFEKYVKEKQKQKANIHLVYSCIAFEFWLLLHFEKNKKPFIWVEKNKSIDIDVVSYFKEKIQPNYEKGFYTKGGVEKSYHAYKCLYQEPTQKHQTKQNDWFVLNRIFSAYKNVKWLQKEMAHILEQQCGKWYEVNPYILGANELMSKLLNIKELQKPIEYFGLTLEFDFDFEMCCLLMKVAVNNSESFVVNNQHAPFFEIKNQEKSYQPTIDQATYFPNEQATLELFYNIPKPLPTDLVLVFKDPRQRSKSSILFVLIESCSPKK